MTGFHQASLPPAQIKKQNQNRNQPHKRAVLDRYHQLCVGNLLRFYFMVLSVVPYEQAHIEEAARIAYADPLANQTLFRRRGDTKRFWRGK